MAFEVRVTYIEEYSDKNLSSSDTCLVTYPDQRLPLGADPMIICHNPARPSHRFSWTPVHRLPFALLSHYIVVVENLAQRMHACQ